MIDIFNLTPLVIVSTLSFIACIGMTAWAARQSEDEGGQSVKDSMKEAWQNIFIGFSINFFTNFLVLPLAGFYIEPMDNFMIGWIYTLISMVRTFGIRRYNNAKEIRKRNELAQQRNT